MSPSESELRSALRQGEGDAVNVDAVVLGAIRVRHARRQRVLSAVGAVVVVAGIAGAGVALTAGDDSRAVHGSAAGAKSAEGAGTAAARPDADRATPTSAASSGSGSSGSVSSNAAVARDAKSVAAAIPCPVAPPRLMLPGGGGTAQFGSDDPIYADPVDAVKVCGYADGGPRATAQVLTGAEAVALVTSLNGAPTSRRGRMCPNSTTGIGATTLLFYAVTPSQQRLRVVTARLGCPGLVTNGTAARYFWSPPTSLSKLITNHSVPIPTAAPDK